jgi:hypothetical protein
MSTSNVFELFPGSSGKQPTSSIETTTQQPEGKCGDVIVPIDFLSKMLSENRNLSTAERVKQTLANHDFSERNYASTPTIDLLKHIKALHLMGELDRDARRLTEAAKLTSQIARQKQGRLGDTHRVSFVDSYVTALDLLLVIHRAFLNYGYGAVIKTQVKAGNLVSASKLFELVEESLSSNWEISSKLIISRDHLKSTMRKLNMIK